MADCPIEPGNMRSCRHLLETALQCLDEARLHQAAAHIEMSLALFDTEHSLPPKGWAIDELPLSQNDTPEQQSSPATSIAARSTEKIRLLYRNIVEKNYPDDDFILRKAHPIAESHRPAMVRGETRQGRDDMFETLLAAGARESAALTLLEPGFSYTVARVSPRGFRASVVIPGTDRAVSADGKTFVAALVAAYLGALVAP